MEEKWLMDREEYEKYVENIIEKDGLDALEPESRALWRETNKLIAEYTGSNTLALSYLIIDLERIDRELALAALDFLDRECELKTYNEFIPLQLEFYNEVAKHVRNAEHYKNIEGNHI